MFKNRYVFLLYQIEVRVDFEQMIPSSSFI